MTPPTSSEQWCLNKQEILLKQVKQLEIKSFRYEIGRLFAALIALISPFLAGHFTESLGLLIYMVTPICIGLFIFLVQKHKIITDQIYFYQNTLDAIKDSLFLLKEPQKPIGSYKRPEKVIPPLEKHWPLSLQETDDIDMYAENTSLFGRLNRTTTQKGQQYLAGLLESPLLEAKDIQDRIALYKELLQQTDQLHLLCGNAKAFQNIEDQFAKLEIALQTQSQIKNSFLFTAAKIYFPIFLILAGLCIGNVLPQPLIILLLIVNFGFAKKIESVIFHTIEPWLSISSLLNYTEMYLQQASQLQIQSPHLKRLQQKTQEIQANNQLTNLKNTVSKLRLRFSGIIHLLIDTLVFWDLFWTAKLETVLKNRETFNEIPDVIGLWEAHIALALHDFINAQGANAEITEQIKIEIINGKHPLIAPEKAIPNNLLLTHTDRAWVISGSNMSGKSTFLRMVGSNILLAQIGLKTYTKAMTLCPIRLMTDLRIRDNLFKNESYFLAEVRQLKRMIDFAREKPILLGLIDEPYRGTNSDERIAASVEVLRNLLESGGFFLTATHDREVTEMAETMPAVSNHHFKEELSESDIAFDYTIRPGATTTRNAIKVLQKEGYPESIIKNAEAYLQTKNKNIRAF